MNRIEAVREQVDQIILKITNEKMRADTCVHLYGVSHFCALLALKRNENVELSVIAGMLHDLASIDMKYTFDHAHKGAELAKKLLQGMYLFEEEEIRQISCAIYHHSDKGETGNPFDEILKDADVMHHVLYNPLYMVLPHEQERFDAIKEELGIV